MASAMNRLRLPRGAMTRRLRGIRSHDAEQQLGDAFAEGGGVGELAALGEDGLAVEQLGVLLERGIALVLRDDGLELRQQRMRRVQLQDAPDLRDFLPRSP